MLNIFISWAALGKRVNLVHFKGAYSDPEMIFDEIDMLNLVNPALLTGTRHPFEEKNGQFLNYCMDKICI